MDEVFISYKSERRRAAEHLAAVLERYGYSVWFDYQLIKGRDFGLQIDRKVREASALVVLWCTRSVASRWVAEEVDLAHELGILIPVKIESCSLPVGFRRQEYIDLSQWDGAPRSHLLDPLIDALQQRIGRRAAPDFNALRDYEAMWRRFGALPLRAFAFDQPPAADEGDRGLPDRASRRVEQAQEQAEEAGPGDRFRDFDTAPEMIVVPAGSFMMGSLEGQGDNDERPQHKVTIKSAFAVSISPITRGEFAAFISATNHKIESGAFVWNGREWKDDPSKSWRDPGFKQEDDHPVACANWHDAQAYVRWLRERSGGKAYRLLSEAEWEYCCRAGTTSAYSTGDAITAAQANFGRNSQGTTPVSRFPANTWGLRDMHGNVWEWCEDNWHKDYNGNPPKDGSVWKGGDPSSRVLRGGSWYDLPHFLRSAVRSRNPPDLRYDYVGFRVARTL